MATWSITKLQRVLDSKRLDANYYLPEYLMVEEKLRKISTFPLMNNFIVSDGNHLTISRYFSNEGDVPYYRGQDISSFFIENSEPVFIPLRIYQDSCMQRSHFQSGDVLLSIVGTIGSLSLIPSWFGSATGSCKIAILRSKGEYSGGFLAAFLLGKYGQLQVKRETRGAVQMGLILEDIAHIRIPEVSTEIQEEIGNIVELAIIKNSESKKLLANAQEMINTELGFNQVDIHHPAGYLTQYSEILGNSRSDAEFYHPRYEPKLSRVVSYKNGWLPLKAITKKRLPTYKPSSSMPDYNYIEIGDVNTKDGSVKSNLIAYEELPTNAKILIEGGEILVSKVRPTRGAIALLDDELPPRTICSGAFYVCTSNDIHFREIIWMYLRCVRSVFQKYCGGTSYPTIERNYLDNFPVPLFSLEFASEITELIHISRSAQQESRILLEEAKTLVERLIEEEIKNETLS